MDNTAKAILAVIAAALCFIALKLYVSTPPTFGDFRALKDIQDNDKRQEQRLKLIEKLPLVRVQGGTIDADIQGSVSIDR